MVSANKPAAVLVAAAISVSALACAAPSEPETGADRHEGVTGCIQWWWTDSGGPEVTTTLHWRNHCPTEQKLMVSWRNDRTNVNPDDVLYGIAGGSEGSDTWPGIPIHFEQL